MNMIGSPWRYFAVQNTGVDYFQDWHELLPENHPCKYCVYSKARPCVGICYNKLMAEFRAKKLEDKRDGKQDDSLH